MSPGASLSNLPPEHRRDRTATAWAAVIAIVFLAIAAASFAIDQTVTLSSHPAPPTSALER